MAETRVQRRLAAVVVADVVGYTGLMARDEAGTLGRLKALRTELLHPKIAEYGGRIVKTTGDGTLIEFGSAVDAVAHAIDVQRCMAQRNAPAAERERLRLRFGINVGDIIIDSGDIYGDGVNVAARLEKLAEPDGICISARVHDHVRGRIGAHFEDLGECALKNVAERVRVFRVRPEAAAATGAEARGEAAKPSIAVLAFDNLDRNADQDFLGDGLAEDIITGLSRIRSFFVIARNSTFQYKGASPDLRKVAAELGVRYVLEGSVRRAGKRVRVTAQLIDGQSGAHVWAERFDRDLDDIFQIQDEITAAIVGRIEPELTRAEYERAKLKAPSSLNAWELFHRAMALVSLRTKAANEKARELFAQSLDLDADFAPAYAGIAWSQAEDNFFGYAEHDPAASLKIAQRAVSLDDKNPFAHLALAWTHTFMRRPELAIEAMETAIHLNPSYAFAHAVLGRLLVHSGRCEDGIAHVELAGRLSPLDPAAGQWTNVLAVGALYLGQYERAVALARKCTQTFDTWAPWLIMVSALGHLGDGPAIAASLGELRRHRPGITIEYARKNYLVFHPPYLDTLIEGLRKAGVPE
jgi:adenylate cyclase